MALSASTVWEIRQTGNDLNGGGYVSGGFDYSVQDSPQVNIDNATITCTTTGANSNTLTFTAGYTPSANDIGNIVHLSAGTNINAGPYQITGQTSTTWTLTGASNATTAGGAGSAIVGRMGGAKATPGVLSTGSASTGGIGSSLVSGQKAWVKYNATAMNCSTSTAGPAGPCSLPSVGVTIEGYDATRGDRTGNRPTYKWTASSPGANTYIYSCGGLRQEILNIQSDGNSVANVSGFNLVARSSIRECVAINCLGTSGFTGTASGTFFTSCKTSGCTTGFQYGNLAYCYATGGTTCFFQPSSAFRCLATSGSVGFSTGSGASLSQGFFQCTADSMTDSGYKNTASYCMLASCIASNCTGSGVGFNVTAANSTTMVNCAYYNNNTNISGTPFVNEGAISLSDDPYVNQAGGDFRPNSTAGGGASIRAAGIGVYGQTDNVDVSAVQHSDAGPFFGYIAMP